MSITIASLRLFSQAKLSGLQLQMAKYESDKDRRRDLKNINIIFKMGVVQDTWLRETFNRWGNFKLIKPMYAVLQP